MRGMIKSSIQIAGQDFRGPVHFGRSSRSLSVVRLIDRDSSAGNENHPPIATVCSMKFVDGMEGCAGTGEQQQLPRRAKPSR